MLAFIDPMIKLGYLPQTNKGIMVKFEDEGQKIKTEESWTVDFISKDSSGISISITPERIDIKCEIAINWKEFESKSKPILNIVEELSGNEFSRIAVGFIRNIQIEKTEAIKEGFLSEEEINDESLKEKTNQRLNRLLLKDTSNLFYNHIETHSISIEPNYCKLKIEYDINTVPGIDSKLVSTFKESFFSEIVNQLNEI